MRDGQEVPEHMMPGFPQKVEMSRVPLESALERAHELLVRTAVAEYADETSKLLHDILVAIMEIKSAAYEAYMKADAEYNARML